MSFLPPQELQRRFEGAVRALQARRPAEARALLEPVVRAAPREPAVRALMGQVLHASGDLEGAIREQRTAAAAAPRDASLATGLGNLLLQARRGADAEAVFKAALKLDPRFPPAATALAEQLAMQGRAAEALAVTEAAEPTRDVHVLGAKAQALKTLGRKAESLAVYVRARDLTPNDAVAWHNVAAGAGDLQRFAEAEAASARARALGLDAPEMWIVRARALQGLDRLDEAEAAFCETLTRRPLYVEAHRDYAQLLWMRWGDADRALARIDAVLRERPGDAAFLGERARLLDYVGRTDEADALMAPVAARADAGPGVLALASQLAVDTDPERAAAHAERAHALLPEALEPVRTLAEARLAQGRVAEADALIARLVAADPEDGGNLALQATAWRLLGDPRAEVLHDYDALVRARTIDAPPGWPDLPAYLRDLAAGLERLHVNTAHPIGQSLRGGSQTNANLFESDDPAVRAFPQAIDGAIRAYIAELGEGDDLFRRRNTGGYAIKGIWSVRLRTGGHHADHMHPEGWISSACYIALPPAVEAGGREGWIKFGEPGVPVRPALAAGHYVKPEPGKLVLFPSYMWHGTVPFSGDTPRLTIAFDLIPA